MSAPSLYSNEEPLLRDYQGVGYNALLPAAMRSKRRSVILQAPCGAGKTRVSCYLIYKSLLKGKRSLFIAGSREIIQQTDKELWGFGIPHEMIWPDDEVRLGCPVQIASEDTLVSRCFKRKLFELPEADLVIIDEAHLMGGYLEKIIRHYQEKGAFVLGMDATPARANGTMLGDLYDEIVTMSSYKELTERNFLVPPTVYGPYTPNLRGVKCVNGEFQRNKVLALMDRPDLVGDTVKWWKQYAWGRQTICFACDVRHSLHLRDEFRRAGIGAEHVDSKTMKGDERDKLIEAYQAGKYEVLCNYCIVGIGFNSPQTSCVILDRPFRSFVLYKQCACRPLRPCPEIGKVDGVIIDCGGNIVRHGFPDEDTVWTLDKSKNVNRPKDRKPKGDDGPEPPITCPHCMHVFSGKSVCPQCGEKLVLRGRPKIRRRGVILPIDRDTPTPEKEQENLQKLWNRCLAVCAQQGVTFRKAIAIFKRCSRGLLPWNVPNLQYLPGRFEWGKAVNVVFPGFVKAPSVSRDPGEEG